MTHLADQLRSGSLTLWLEVAPPRGVNTQSLLERLSVLKGHVDAINLTDNALGKVKMSALVFASIVQRELGIPTVLNFSCRDRNLLALKADLLGAGAIGVAAVVALTGDKLVPATSPDGAPSPKAVHDVDAIGLLKIIAELNRGEIGEVKPLKSPPKLLAGAVANPNRKDLSRELDLLARKVEAGAQFVMTQPVFDYDTAASFAARAKTVGVPVILGILPIKRAQMAQYIATKIKDLASARSYLESYALLDPEQARARSIEHNLELMTRLASEVAGFNIMSGGGPSLAIELALKFNALRRNFERKSD